MVRPHAEGAGPVRRLNHTQSARSTRSQTAGFRPRSNHPRGGSPGLCVLAAFAFPLLRPLPSPPVGIRHPPVGIQSGKGPFPPFTVPPCGRGADQPSGLFLTRSSRSTRSQTAGFRPRSNHPRGESLGLWVPAASAFFLLRFLPSPIPTSDARQPGDVGHSCHSRHSRFHTRRTGAGWLRGFV